MSAVAIEPSASQTVRADARRGRGWWLKRGAIVFVLVVIGLAVSGFIYQAAAIESDRRSLPAPGQRVDVSGSRRHLWCVGQGSPTVVLETGLGAWSSHWALIQPAVAEHTRVCSYDRAGLGWSQAGSLPRDAHQIASELYALLQAADVRAPYVLAGHSNGGLYARMFTSLHPSEVVGLVLADPTPVDLFERLPSTRRDFSNVEQQARAFAWLAPTGIVRLLIPSAVASDLGGFPERARGEIIAINSTGPHWAGVAAELEALPASMVQVAQSGDLGSRPLLVLSSTRGSAASVEEATIKLQLDAEVAALSSNSRHVVVDSATHTGLATHPEHARIVASSVRQVVDSVRSGLSVNSTSTSLVDRSVP